MQFTTVLFDVDGVMLKEEAYFNATSQTVHEIIVTERFLGKDKREPNTDTARTAEIRRQVLGEHDEVLDFLKGRGVNSNWDMAYLLSAHSILKNLAQAADRDWARNLCKRGITFADFSEIRQKLTVVPAFDEFIADFPEGLQKHQFLQYLNQLAVQWLDVETDFFGRISQLWEEVRGTFQEFYLGDGKQKPGYLEREEPILAANELQNLLTMLTKKGVILGIATGRPQTETLIPLTSLGVTKFIPEERIVTATTVIEAEQEVPEAAPLGKPNPFSYLRALRGMGPSNAEILKEKLPLNRKDVLIVGDSLADLLCAHSLGTSFAATLTGHEGDRARVMFEKHGADYILETIKDVRSLFE